MDSNNGDRENAQNGTAAASGELDALLTRIGERFRVAFAPLVYGETTLRVLDVANMTEILDRIAASGGVKDPLKELPLWAKIWPGSFVLETYLRKKTEPAGRSLLELGCGCGVLSLLAARLGFSRVVASDLEEEALLFARANVLENGLDGKVEVARVDVREPGSRAIDGRFDFIAASEILYLDDLHTPLLKFVERHLAEGGQAVFCTDMARGKPRFAKKAAKRFKVQELYVPGSHTTEEGEVQKRLYNLTVLRK